MIHSVPDSPLQRSRGKAMVSFADIGGRTRLRDLVQAGSGKAMLPRVAGVVPEVVFLNTSGGLTGGDRLEYRLTLGPGCRVCATSQTAERAYASTGPAAAVRVGASVAAGAWLDWLPQETILFEASHLQRDTEINLAADAGCLLIEQVVLGRHAMGETLRDARLTDRRMVRRAGRPFWAEVFRLDAQILQANSAALLGEARAFATIALIAPDAADALTRLRAVLDEPGCVAAASGWDGRCIARITARDGWPLKRQLARAVAVLRNGPAPRVWQMQGVTP